MIRYSLLLLLCGPTLSATGQEALHFYGREHFLIEGTVVTDARKESPYDRLPAELKTQVREPVWALSRSSAGLSVRFRTNSPAIHLRWTLLNDASMDHMADTGIKGVDLYVKEAGQWRYVNTARPSGMSNEARLISGMSRELREFKLYLPLYDGIADLEIGIEADASIETPAPAPGRPIIFYGTSITQGGCASRPGMAHTNIIARKLDIDCVNLGFSGNGKMETPIVELMAETGARFYVVECLPNMTAAEVAARTAPLVQRLRAAHPATPIVLVENTRYESAFLDPDLATKIAEKNAVLAAEYRKLIEAGVPQLYYLETVDALGDDHEGTVDGVHLTDLGFLRYADHLIGRFRAWGLVE